MANEDKKENNITLDGKPVTSQELTEAQNNPSVRIIEDNNNPNAYKTLHRIQG